MSGNPQLRAFLEDLIAARGPLPFSEYMETVLYHPEFGYYSSDRDPIGPEGDFYTAASVDPAMGQMLARLFADMAQDIPQFRVIELGAGSGLLARHILESHAFSYSILERSAAMRQRQRTQLEGMEVEWLERLPSDFRGCIFSNEFFDALPVRRFVRRGGVVQEIFVAPGLREVEGKPRTRVDLPMLEEDCVADLAPGASAWIRKIGSTLVSGYHLAIDYGYLEKELFARKRGTLMCYRGHRADADPYQDPGGKDITAHVDFSELIRSGSECGLELAGYTSQKDFLIDLGLLEVMAPLTQSGGARSIRRLQALKGLILPPMMGERFRVLLQRKGLIGRELRGFRNGFSGTE